MKFLLMAGALSVFFFYTEVKHSYALSQPQTSEQEGIAAVTDDELHLFLNASMAVENIKEANDFEIEVLLEKKGLDIQTFMAIRRGEIEGGGTEVTADDLKVFESIAMEIGDLTRRMELNMISAIGREGLTLERFQEIFEAVQASPLLQQQIHAIFTEHHIE